MPKIRQQKSHTGIPGNRTQTFVVQPAISIVFLNNGFLYHICNIFKNKCHHLSRIFQELIIIFSIVLNVKQQSSI